MRRLLIPLLVLMVVPYSLILITEAVAARAARKLERWNERACRWVWSRPRR